ncbi:MAG TPA: hypothetical protein VMZ27_02165, partial [Candidatus Saccharimonadales bacterium]|nr:hypothetical protein [Candidatus Saccharimonadales bacterium]
PDAMVYLGCLTDSSSRVREWVELWVQNVDGLESSLPTLSDTFSNHSIDERWGKTAASFRALNPEGCIETGFEKKHPSPAFLDLGRKVPVHPGTPEKKWELCQEDAALQQAGLPPYSTSLFRYIYQPDARESGFVPVVSRAPASPATRSLAEALKDIQTQVPFNPQGGLLMAHNFAPLAYDEYSDLLGGKPWKGIEHGKKTIHFEGVYGTLGDWDQMQQSGSHFFLGGQGRAGRFVESFHLKLQIFLEAISAVRAFVEEQQLPFLNLSTESFRVSLNELGAKLPYLWTAKGMLVKPSQAYALPVESSDFRYFIRARAGGTSVYHPENLSRSLQSSGSVRIRKVLPPDQDRTLLEGTLVMEERMSVSPHDLLWIRLPLPAGRVDLYGNLYSTDGLAQGEARFRTVPQKLAPEVVTALRAAEGVSFARSPFEVVPLLSTPCDLYALGVLAVRTFLVNQQNTLPVALDEVLSLARQVATEYKADVPLATRISSILNSDQRFVNSLGPQRLAQEPMDSKAAFEFLPAELWHQTLAAIVRFFPGLGPDSYCKDFGDAPSLALDVIFNKPLEDLEKLLVRSRSLIVIDWRANREVHSAIRDMLDRQKS